MLSRPNSISKVTFQPLPLPKYNSTYSKGKEFEYDISSYGHSFNLIFRLFRLTRDLDQAKKFYMMAIEKGERLESAIKDLATILHQEGSYIYYGEMIYLI